MESPDAVFASALHWRPMKLGPKIETSPYRPQKKQMLLPPCLSKQLHSHAIWCLLLPSQSLVYICRLGKSYIT